MKTYTQHRLTDHMLHRLSQISNGHTNNWGMSFWAIHRRNLVDYDPNNPRAGIMPRINDAGREALDQARREGW